MHTTMLCSSGVFSTATMCSPWRPVKPSEAIAAVASSKEPVAVVRIGPGLGHDPARRCGADLRLVGLDQHVDRRGVDVALLDEDRFERAHAQLDLGQLAVVVIVVVGVVVIDVRSGRHGSCSTHPPMLSDPSAPQVP